ncbi:hypothetical protein [Desulfobacter hydrogenophilus]|nr:hypothetical protein [Desulfobacter hydrogenophilus]NDY71143.1 hypothetical protein [Desulfobacter hydrogenophilus]QBH14255.1 hypothetical protein EYB58_15830 [Desulfobacter hydrogenophilus]
MRRIKVKETIDRRALGALRLVDNATKTPVGRAMTVFADGLKFFPNRSHLYVISHARGLESHLTAFESPPDASNPNEPDIGSQKFNVTIRDPLGKYLTRSLQLSLPLNPDREEDDHIFKPIQVPLFSSPTCDLNPNWSIIRASVFDLADINIENPTPVQGALLRISNASDEIIAGGMSDKRGEAVIIVPGIPVSDFAREEDPELDDEDLGSDNEDDLASGSVVEMETPVKLTVVVATNAPWPVDPEKLKQNIEDLQKHFRSEMDAELINELDLKLKTGKTQSIRLFIDLTQD